MTKIYHLKFAEILTLNDGAKRIYDKKFNGRVLIVEDDELISDMYKTKFEKEGYEVFTAGNGREGLSVAERETPDIILTDIVMPEYNGFYLLKQIKNNPALKDIPVITLSNLNDSGKRRKACELGTLYFLVKSEFLPKEMFNIVKEVLSVRKKNNKVFAI